MSEPIRVLLLDTVMDRGGAEAMTMNYLRNMDRSKVTYDFLVHREYKAAYEDEITSLGGKIYRICPPYPQNYFKYRKQLRKFLKEHPEYKIMHSNMMDLTIFAYMEAVKQNIPVRILHSHIASSKGRRISLGEIVHKIYRKNILKYTTHKFACGKDAGKFLYGANCSDYVIMPNAIETERFVYQKIIEDKIRKTFRLQGKFVVGHVGRFFQQKNHSFIIDIFNEISKLENQAVLMLIGGGEINDKIQNEIKTKVDALGLHDKVIFTGVRTDVNEIMQSFDVFILPSLREGFPVVMVEAQATGLKCVISDKVPPECDITGNVEVVPLASGAEKWAERILSYKDAYVKKDMYDAIVKAGFDIKENAKWLENFYIALYNK